MRGLQLFTIFSFSLAMLGVFNVQAGENKVAPPKKTTSPSAAAMREEFQGACRMPDNGPLYPGELGASPGTPAAQALAWYKENEKTLKELKDAGYKLVTPGNYEKLQNLDTYYHMGERKDSLPVCDLKAQAYTIEVRAPFDHN